jgi:hypothetical protein
MGSSRRDTSCPILDGRRGEISGIGSGLCLTTHRPIKGSIKTESLAIFPFCRASMGTRLIDIRDGSVIDVNDEMLSKRIQLLHGLSLRFYMLLITYKVFKRIPVHFQGYNMIFISFPVNILLLVYYLPIRTTMINSSSISREVHNLFSDCQKNPGRFNEIHAV